MDSSSYSFVTFSNLFIFLLFEDVLLYSVLVKVIATFILGSKYWLIEIFAFGSRINISPCTHYGLKFEVINTITRQHHSSAHSDLMDSSQPFLPQTILYLSPAISYIFLAYITPTSNSLLHFKLHNPTNTFSPGTRWDCLKKHPFQYDIIQFSSIKTIIIHPNTKISTLLKEGQA